MGYKGTHFSVYYLNGKHNAKVPNDYGWGNQNGFFSEK